MSDVSQIDGSAVRLRREAQGWAITDLAARACLSVKQVRQIEEGGLSSFYSESVELTAAPKSSWTFTTQRGTTVWSRCLSERPHLKKSPLLFATQVAASPSLQVTDASVPTREPAHSGVHLSRSEPLHFLAQPPEPELTERLPVKEAHQPFTVPNEAPVLDGPAVLPSQDKTEDPEPTPSGNYFLKILVYILVAIAVAALLRPKSVEITTPANESNAGQSMTAPPVVAPQNPAIPSQALQQQALTLRPQKLNKTVGASDQPAATTAPSTTAPSGSGQ
jgi:hypothetical protein